MDPGKAPVFEWTELHLHSRGIVDAVEKWKAVPTPRFLAIMRSMPWKVRRRVDYDCVVDKRHLRVDVASNRRLIHTFDNSQALFGIVTHVPFLPANTAENGCVRTVATGPQFVQKTHSHHFITGSSVASPPPFGWSKPDAIICPMHTIEHRVGGKTLPGSSGTVPPVFDPATGVQSARVSLASADEVDRPSPLRLKPALQWGASTLSDRAAILFRLRDLFERRSFELAALTTAEHGKVLSDAAGEVARGLENVGNSLAPSPIC